LGLAPLIVRDLFAIIKSIRDDGTTVLLVEQNAVGALKIADYAYVLEVGNIRMEGLASDLIKDPALIEAYLGQN
jgi:branched-chain amino acid transport system ATP-binding protein